jgi:hypothetical protein
LVLQEVAPLGLAFAFYRTIISLSHQPQRGGLFIEIDVMKIVTGAPEERPVIGCGQVIFCEDYVSLLFNPIE